MPRRQRNLPALPPASSTNRPLIDLWVTPEEYERLRRLRVPRVPTYTRTQYHIGDRSQAFIRPASSNPDHHRNCYRFEIMGASWRFISAVSIDIAMMGETLNIISFEIDDYDGGTAVYGFHYQGLNVELVVYRLAEEDGEIIWTTGQRISLPARPWMDGRVD
jgi:hypothetical protein